MERAPLAERRIAQNTFVFLHGFMGSSLDWLPVISHAFVTNQRYLAYDLPGHGNTPWGDQEINSLFAEQFPQNPFHLVGYSLGGRLALQFAYTYPQRIKTLTLLSTHYGLNTQEERIERLTRDATWSHLFLKEPWEQAIKRWYSQDIFASLKQKKSLLEKILSMRTDQNQKFLAKALTTWSLGRQKNFFDLLHNCPFPLRILYGSLDSKFSSLYAGWPHAIALPDAGHCLHLEAPERVARSLFA